MGTVFKKQATRPLPKGAELFTKRGQQFARWTAKSGRKRTDRVRSAGTGPSAS
jgi:hypothetical protein